MGALDPGKDYGLLQSLGNELDEFVEMYYSPCIAALFGTNIGSNPDVEPQYFLAYGWLTHDACAHLSCLADNMRWDRRLGGCTAGTITGTEITFGAEDDLDHCAKDDSPLYAGVVERCKHKEVELAVFQDKANDCWESAGTVPYYIMNHFCMPQLTGNVAEQILITELMHFLKVIIVRTYILQNIMMKDMPRFSCKLQYKLKTVHVHSYL